MRSSEKITLQPVNNDNIDILYERTKVGSFTLSGDDPVYIGFVIDKAYRGCHYGAAGVFLLLRYLHEKRHISTIRAIVDKGNDMAIHVLEHNGFAKTDEDDKLLFEHCPRITADDRDYLPPAGMKAIYMAAGCFWGAEKAFKQLAGIYETRCGYANGHIDRPTYEMIMAESTGFKETVRITYDPSLITLEKLLRAFFMIVDVTLKDAQGPDVGYQYQSGVYYTDEKDREILEAVFEKEKKKHEAFRVELEELACFYEAEDYHQDYLTKNPGGYCHIGLKELEQVKALNEKARSRGKY